MRIAITTDWLATFGGAEHVIAEMISLWPEADIFTTVHDPEKTSVLGSNFSNKVHASSLERVYRIVRDHRILIPFMPRAVESWDLRGYDIIISSSHAVAKGCIPENSAHHLCYCHTPMRYAWEMEEEYLDDFGVPRVLRKTAKRQLEKLRRWDLATAKRVDTFIANSKTTQERIKRIYNRESIVLHPPVDDRFFKDMRYETPDTRHYLSVGRLVPYKRVDLLIEVANRRRLPLKIAGTGPEEAKLRRLAGSTVEFLGYVPDADLPALYTQAKAFLFPVHEDAGITPLEAQACGTPVIAYGKGGALDTVREGETGLFFREQTPDSLIEAVEKFEGMQFDPRHIQEHAKSFSSERFRGKLSEVVQENIPRH